MKAPRRTMRSNDCTDYPAGKIVELIRLVCRSIYRMALPQQLPLKPAYRRKPSDSAEAGEKRRLEHDLKLQSCSPAALQW